MNDEQEDERWTPEEWEEIKAHRSRYAEIKRRERLGGAVENVMSVYQYLHHLADEGSDEARKYDRLFNFYMDVEKSLWKMTREEQDEILEEYPRLVAALKEEHGIEW
ncbi:hypothetical protein ABZ512_10655 [Nocardiopsis dassonvillei]|uniref:hypothetical protein n=1 Tax=Nocardiopsis dassonvillei TaxID=2014 RepID=UPI00157D40BC|nr:hypothetical protein [Nocardiopsis dassonvillei]